MTIRLFLFLLVATACNRQSDRVSVPMPEHEQPLDQRAIDEGRRDQLWRDVAERDRQARRGTPSVPADARDTTPARAKPDTAASERYEEITPSAANAAPRFPFDAEAGPTVLYTQVMLDRAGFSPGVIDGYWGRNTSAALYWFQDAVGLPTTGEIDRTTLARLAERAGEGSVVGRYEVSSDDLDGPFVSIPSGMYDRAELDCLCYTSPRELLAERFHTTPELLAQLNPGVDLARLAAGTMLAVPNVGAAPGPAAGRTIDRIIVSKDGGYTHAVDPSGEIVHHFPTTVGSEYDPSPSGEWKVTKIAMDPPFHYQPDLFHEVPDWKPDATLPPGPNSPVGLVWMQLSKPHYGIHGTSEPSTIGYVSSHGCIRLTNWDAMLLAQRVEEGTRVEFTR